VTLPRVTEEHKSKKFDIINMYDVGASDRGSGLNYRDPAPEPLEKTVDLPRPMFIVKVQPPLDNSNDARGGMGRMTPTTLLINDQTGAFVRHVFEEETGHMALLRCALSSPGQVGYCYAEEDLSNIKIFTKTRPPADNPMVGW
jgi:hypothetical protein